MLDKGNQPSRVSTIHDYGLRLAEIFSNGVKALRTGCDVRWRESKVKIKSSRVEIAFSLRMENQIELTALGPRAFT